ncbi:MAG: putative transporter [Akkermansiaceae bacterium]|nr:putative transporter [Akkermansiaceae bacterium]
MEFFENIKQISPHAEPILVISITAILGLLIGSVKVRGIKLGVAGMLFSGLLLGHFGFSLDPHLLSFLKEFGLALFVFTVGLQLGPGFFNSLKKDGLKLNALAVTIVLSGALLIFVMGRYVLGWNAGALAGIFSGATTNTPSLGAAQQAMSTAGKGDLASQAAMAYAVAYPFGVMGIILVIVMLRVVFRIDPQKELAELKEQMSLGVREPKRASLRVENPNLEGVPIRNVPGLGDDGAVVSRIRRRDETEVHSATSDTLLHVGDVILAVGTVDQLERATLSIGVRVEEDLRKAPGNIIAKRIIVTHKDMIGQTIAGTRISERFGVTVSRVSRQDMILTAIPDLKLQFGDMLNIVGEEAAINQAANVLGNSVHQLNETSFASIFVGITVGIFFGLYPWPLPGMPVPLRLGLAGGPLIIAILMGRLGRIGPLVVHMPINANTAFRELGIIFFLACVGLGAGGKFVETAFSATGLQWMAMGAVVTTVPLMIAGFIGRKFMKINYLTLTGVLAGSMTDPPALAFSTKLTNSDYPSLAYANVYPLTMLMRILVAQIAVLWLC